ncbi:MAG: 2,3-bisphosphoglycerate-independent phosphoglycerate mutase [Syntrophaceae bacterium]|jgi:2,3-bisphosphoglycerate-independent phosphoglycerate mutase|nr:2,3-bisphosphoglycerate-independent phosphoglycerate mutase [Syntrophaceae bacterium]
MKKCLLILLDGLGDRSFLSLEHCTPLQAAYTPALDAIARSGASGLYHAASLGQALPSENAHFAIFGFDPDDFPGRGALEALGAGVALSENDVALLAHLASLKEDKGFLFTRRDTPAASPAEIEAILSALPEKRIGEVRIRFHPIKGLFGVLILQGNVSPYVTDTNHMTDGWPLMAVAPWQPHARDNAARETSKALSRYLIDVYRHLDAHSVNAERRRRGHDSINGLVTQRAGRIKTISSFSERYGLKGLSISSGALFKGMCGYLGLDFLRGQESDNPEEEIAGRLVQAHDAFDDYDFIHVHTKTPDEAAHKKDPLLKKSVIEALDRGISRTIGPFLADPDMLVIVTSDHSTPSEGPLIHSGEPVPLTMHGCGVRQDGVQTFDEVACAPGALGMVRGKEMMYLVLNYLNRAKLVGIMDTPVDQPFWPGLYDWFSLKGENSGATEDTDP